MLKERKTGRQETEREGRKEGKEDESVEGLG